MEPPRASKARNGPATGATRLAAGDPAKPQFAGRLGPERSPMAASSGRVDGHMDYAGTIPSSPTTSGSAPAACARAPAGDRLAALAHRRVVRELGAGVDLAGAEDLGGGVLGHLFPVGDPAG